MDDLKFEITVAGRPFRFTGNERGADSNDWAALKKYWPHELPELYKEMMSLTRHPKKFGRDTIKIDLERTAACTQVPIFSLGEFYELDGYMFDDRPDDVPFFFDDERGLEIGSVYLLDNTADLIVTTSGEVVIFEEIAECYVETGLSFEAFLDNMLDKSKYDTFLFDTTDSEIADVNDMMRFITEKILEVSKNLPYSSPAPHLSYGHCTRWLMPDWVIDQLMDDEIPYGEEASQFSIELYQDDPKNRKFKVSWEIHPRHRNELFATMKGLGFEVTLMELCDWEFWKDACVEKMSPDAYLSAEDF